MLRAHDQTANQHKHLIIATVSQRQ